MHTFKKWNGDLNQLHAHRRANFELDFSFLTNLAAVAQHTAYLNVLNILKLDHERAETETARARYERLTRLFGYAAEMMDDAAGVDQAARQVFGSIQAPRELQRAVSAALLYGEKRGEAEAYADAAEAARRYLKRG